MTSAVRLFVAFFTVRVLSSCSLADSPSDIRLSSPVLVASDGRTIIFKADGESDNCGLGGVVSFEADGSTSLRFTYERTASARGDIASVRTAAGTFSVDGYGAVALMGPGDPTVWRRLGSPQAFRRSRAGSELVASAGGRGRVDVRATDARRRLLFAATFLPRDGTIDIPLGTFTRVASTYSGHAEHDCGDWDTAAAAAAALERVRRRIPK